jgi:hypothetical protein
MLQPELFRVSDVLLVAVVEAVLFRHQHCSLQQRHRSNEAQQND